MAGRRQPDRYAIRAVDRAIDVLMAFTHSQHEYTLGELATEVGLEKPTVHRIIRTLEARGFIERRPNGHYALGKMLPTLGMIVVESWELRDLVMPAVRQIAHETGETACCSILDGDEVLTVASVPGQQRLRLAIVPGERAPAAITADGKVLLASLSGEQVLRTVAHEHPAYPGKSKPWLRRLLGELDDVRRTGVGYDLEEHQPDMRGVAVPIHNHRGAVAAAMMIAAPSSRLDDVRIRAVAQTLKALTPQGIPWTVDSGLRQLA